MTENYFNTLFLGSVGSYPDDTQLSLRELNFDGVNYKDVEASLINIANDADSKLVKSICYRIIALDRFQSLINMDGKYSIKEVWEAIYRSLIELNTDQLISSIGSQGFLAIPLYRLDKGDHSFELLRLHFWSSDFDKHINKETRDYFSIHSHQFHANSWILAGEVYNTRVDVQPCTNKTDHSVFKIQWNDPKKDLNRKGSTAINTYEFCEVLEGHKEVYSPGDFYELAAGKFHLSRTNENKELNATLFYFSTQKSRVPNSFVLGPSSITESEINRKIQIDPKKYLEKLNTDLNAK